MPASVAGSPPPSAFWSMLTPRFYAVDNDAGNDANLGYSDVSLAAAGAVALKTHEELLRRLPVVGAGRQLVVGYKPRSGGVTYKKADGTTDDDLDLRNVVGYRYRLVRGTDFTDSLEDKAKCGAVVAQAGPNGDQSWTVAGGGTATTFTVAAGVLSASPALVQRRVRFASNTTTVALRNVCRNIEAHTLSNVTVGTDLPATPAAGDTFFIEKPGVVFSRVYDEHDGAADDAGVGSASTMTQRGTRVLVGVAGTSAASYAVHITGSLPAHLSFCDVRTTAGNFGLIVKHGSSVMIEDQYPDVDGTMRSTGVGVYCQDRAYFGRMEYLRLRSSGLLSTASNVLQDVEVFEVGAGGSRFASAVSMTR